MTESTFIFAKVTPKPDFFDAAIQAIRKIIPQTRNEPGCISFVLHEDGRGNLFLYEEWVNDKALEIHHEMDYTKAVFEAYKEWLATPPEITKLIKLA